MLMRVKGCSSEKGHRARSQDEHGLANLDRIARAELDSLARRHLPPTDDGSVGGSQVLELDARVDVQIEVTAGDVRLIELDIGLRAPSNTHRPSGGQDFGARCLARQNEKPQRTLAGALTE
jgi:hypothetical protein